MQEFVINSFKYGLDTRKDVLTSQPGTLVTCENAHVNPGGEIEKRKIFEEYANLVILDDDGFQGIFGLEVAGSDLVAFGSAFALGAPTPAGLPSLVSTVPGVITYRTLFHPTLDFDEDYDFNLHRLIAIDFSENYNGKFFVIATFADGNTFLYYEGDSQNPPNPDYYRAVKQSYSGQYLQTTFGEDLTRQFQDIGWIVEKDVDEDGITEDNSIIIKSPQADYFTPIATVISNSGRIGIKNIDQDGESSAGVKAVAGFQITVNTGTFTLQAPVSEVGATPIIELCGGAVAAQASATATCTLIARMVNDLTSAHGYSALSLNDSVFVYAPASWGNFTFNLTVTVTTGTAAAAGAPPTALRGVIDPSPLDTTLKLTRNRTTIVKSDAKIDASGGTGPYKFLWEETTVGAGNGIKITQFNSALHTNNADVSFSKDLFPNTVVKGNFKCNVQDSTGAVVTVFLTVSLQTVYKSGQ